MVDLDYLEFILIEFDLDSALEEGAIIRYFREGLKFLVRVEMEQYDWNLNIFEKIVEKVLDVEAKAILSSYSYIYEINQHYP